MLSETTRQIVHFTARGGGVVVLHLYHKIRDHDYHRLYHFHSD